MNPPNKFILLCFYFLKSSVFLHYFFLIITHSTASEIHYVFYKPKFIDVYGGGSGKKKGFWEFRYKNGNISSVGNYKNGKRVGIWNVL